MRRLCRFLFVAVVPVLFSFVAYASHMIGGDITYRCLGNDTFEITLTLFQDCLYGEPQAIAQDDPAYYAIYTSGSGRQLVRQGSVPSNLTERVDPNFSNACINNYPNTCLSRQVFRFKVVLPPSATGYDIVYQRCCRNASINNIVNPGNVGVTYSAKIPPFNQGECPNNSAVFKSLPPQIICSNNPFVYDFSATDPDGDSLSYELCTARLGGSTSNPLPMGRDITPPPHTSVPYMPPYSPSMPISGMPPMQINPVTGMMTGTPSANGRFVVTVCVNEWRNGQIINTVSRDVQFVVTNCSKAVVANIPEMEDVPNTYTIQCKGYTVRFTNSSTGGFEYYWEFGVPGATSTEFEPTYTYPDTGTYTVKLYVNRGSTCQDSITRLVKIYPEFKTDFEWAGRLCPESPIRFYDSTKATYPPIVSWNWNFGDGTTSGEQNPEHIFSKPGGPRDVTLISKSALGCRDTVTKTVPLPYFNPFAGNDTIIVLGYDFNLRGTGSTYYKWWPEDYLSDPNIADPKVTFPDTGRYKYVLIGTNEEGCVATDTIEIWVVRTGSVFVPNAFSPNGDGKNDVLMPRTVGYSEITSFRIYNRYGQLVFSSVQEAYPSWDGTYNNRIADIGTYYYIIELVDAFGKKSQQTGDITLIR